MIELHYVKATVGAVRAVLSLLCGGMAVWAKLSRPRRNEMHAFFAYLERGDGLLSTPAKREAKFGRFGKGLMDDDRLMILSSESPRACWSDVFLARSVMTPRRGRRGWKKAWPEKWQPYAAATYVTTIRVGMVVTALIAGCYVARWMDDGPLNAVIRYAMILVAVVGMAHYSAKIQACDRVCTQKRYPVRKKDARPTRQR